MRPPIALREPTAEFGTAWIGEGVDPEVVPLLAAVAEEVVTVLRLDEEPLAAAEDDTLAGVVKVELLSTEALVETTAELVTAGALALALEEAVVDVA